MENNNYKVYMHTSPSGKVYVGITKLKTSQRWRNGEGYKNNIHFYSAIQNYGWDNFAHEILFENLSKKEAEKIEIDLISIYKANDKNFGYNIASGGGVNIPTEETRRKISEANGVKIKCVTDGKVFKSIKQASEFYRISRDCITKNITGKSKTTHGMVFEYLK